MKRMIRAAAAAAILVSGLGSVGCVSTGTTGCGSGGCGGGTGGAGVAGARGEGHGPLGDCYRNWVDPCYPERYNVAARQAVLAPFGQQVFNGHVMNQTVYNYYFDFGSDVLTPAGIEKLNSLARVRPAPDPRIFIQTARDLPSNLDPAKAEVARVDLDAKRAATVLKYMANQPAFAPITYEILVHDPIVPSIYSEFGSFAFRGSQQGYRGNVSGGGTGVLGTGSGGGSLTAPPTSGGAPR
jgi:hypothetical protein